jgi:pilus assembly protein CpaE
MNFDPDAEHTEVVLTPDRRVVERARAHRQALPEKAPGMLLAFLSAKGGCGATFIASNLAAALAAKRRVLLVDLDMSKGDVAGYLDLRSGKSVNPLLRRLKEFDERLLEGTVDVLPSGLHVLAQPFDIADIHQLEAGEVRMLLEGVRGHYDVVIVDVGSSIDVAALAAATMADHVVLLTTPDVPAVRSTRRTLRLLTQVEVPARSVRLVLNKRPSFGALSPEEIARQVEQPVVCSVRRDVATCTRVDTFGRPLVEIAPRAGVTRDVKEMWAHIHGLTSPRRSLWARLFGRKTAALPAPAPVSAPAQEAGVEAGAR